MGFRKRGLSRGDRIGEAIASRNRHEADWSNRQVAIALSSITAAAIIPGLLGHTALAQVMFPDVPADYWAQPFIQALAQREILEGYPDGTFRPEEPIDRDEYAAVIREAFDKDMERSLESASTLNDVPEDYWAAPAIEEAYEMGFMGLPDPNEFNPQNEITRANAILALVQGLNLSETPPATVTAAPTTTPTPTPTVEAERQGTPFYFAFPMASTELMRLFAPPAPMPVAEQTATPPPVADDPVAASPATTSQPPVPLTQYYDDADLIPEYARDEVALATRLGLVVNYPDARLLNPTQPISRGAAAALIHQALVYQNELEPLPEGAAAATYEVEPEPAASN